MTDKQKIKEEVLKDNTVWTLEQFLKGINKGYLLHTIDLAISKTAEAIFEDILKVRGFIKRSDPNDHSIMLRASEWEELKKKWVKK